MEKEKKCVEKLVYSSYFFMMMIILSVCVLGNSIYYSRKREALFPELIMLVIGIILMIGIMALTQYIVKKYYRKNDIAIWIISISLMFFQIYCVWNYYFLTDWDVALIFSASETVAKGSGLEEFQYYFSRYPNNLLLVFIYGKLIKFFQQININYRMGILAFQSILSWGTGIILYFTVKEMQKEDYVAWFAWIVYLLLIGISPWVSIPYSDSMGIIFPIAIINLYFQTGKYKGKLKMFIWSLIGILTIIGYKIKPQISIITIAIFIFCIFYGWQNKKNFVYNTVALIFGFIMGVLVSTTCINSMGIEINSDETYGLSHFLMMGMNYSEGASGNGVYNSEDVEFSAKFLTAEDRKKANFQVTEERIKEMGISGMAHLMHRKILTNYNDGTFCWGGEGTFYIKMLSNKENIFSKFLRNIYYKGKNYIIFYNFELMIWLAILFFGMIAAIQKKKRSWLAILFLSIIGLTIFELLFEARSRYLYTYAPIYILLASIGAQQFLERKDRK